ncbi:MAG: response regulator [Gammaproteobacteria bacterium]|nr:response regulator [Gammaproteobacteria bacterium]
METSELEKGTLLIVDDVPTNLKVLLTYLDEQKFEVRVAEDGEDALEQVSYSKPDLILMDVMMPNMDGFEACRRLKAKNETSDIPIIFMTALNDTVDKVKGFEIGAVDYITKPVQQEEVLARVKAHLTLRNLHKFLGQQNAALEQQTQEIKQQNVQLDAFSNIVVRDLKRPLANQAGFIKLLMKSTKSLADNPEMLTSYLQQLEHSRQKIAEVADDLLLLTNARTQQVEMEAPDMVSIVAHARNRLAAEIKEAKARITVPTNWPPVWGYSAWLEKIWATYIGNALEFGGRPPRVELGATPEADGTVRFWVRDNGPGISTERQRDLFVPFSNISGARTDEGYRKNLAIVQLLIEKLGGKTGVESQAGQGSTFYFTLPAIG